MFNIKVIVMLELTEFNSNGLEPFDEGLLSEAEMLEVLGGDTIIYTYNNECHTYLKCPILK